MANIERSEYHKKRYFAALGMFMDDVCGIADVADIAKKYNISVGADENRVKVSIELEGLTDKQVEKYRKSKE